MLHTSIDYNMCFSSYTVNLLAFGPSGCCSCCALVRPRPNPRTKVPCGVLALTPMYVFSPRISLHLLGSTGQGAPDSYLASKILRLFFLRPAQFHRLSDVPSKLHTRNPNINRARLTPCVILPLFRWDPVAPSPLSSCPTPKPSFKSRTPLMVTASSPPLAACRAFLGSPGVRINTKL